MTLPAVKVPGGTPSTVIFAFFREFASDNPEISSSISFPATSLMVDVPTFRGFVVWVISSPSGFPADVSPSATV